MPDSETLWCETRSGDLRPDGVSVQHVRGEPGTLLLSGKPDWALDPVTGQRVRFEALLTAPESLPCPACSATVEAPTVGILAADGHPDHCWVGLDCPACRQWSFRMLPRR
jgi:hypothetical protein